MPDYAIDPDFLAFAVDRAPNLAERIDQRATWRRHDREWQEQAAAYYPKENPMNTLYRISVASSDGSTSRCCWTEAPTEAEAVKACLGALNSEPQAARETDESCRWVVTMVIVNPS